MARPKKVQDTTLLSMALVGYESEMLKLEENIRKVHALLDGKKGKPATAAALPDASPKRRTLSPSARKRIAAAQKKRWAEHRKAAAAAAE